MSAPRRADTEEYIAASALAREVRQTVAEQLRELVIESDRMAGRGEVAARVQRVVDVERQIEQARGRQEQARLMGMPVAVHVAAEREWRGLLRDALMSASVACGAWVAAMDYQERRSAVEVTANGHAPAD